MSQPHLNHSTDQSKQMRFNNSVMHKKTITELAPFCHKSTAASMPDKREWEAREAERESEEDLPILLNSWWEMKMTREG